MKRPIKFLLLFLALLLPALVYVFLKTFGRNEFAVPALFQEAVEVPAGCASYVYSFPYVVSQSALSKLGWQRDSVALVVLDATSHRVAVKRVTTEFPGVPFSLIELTTAMQPLAGCALLLQSPADAVILDSEGAIRGQYDLDDRDDVDRLILEMNIMLKRY